MFRAAAFAAATLLPLAATIAQPSNQPPGAPDPTRVAPGVYKLDPAHSQVIFSVNHMGLSDYAGQFTDPTGSLTIDPAKPAQAKVEVAFQVAKVATTSPALDQHLQKPDFFDAAKYPEVRFVSTRVVVSGRSASVSGNLTIRGVTRPVVLAARFVGAGANAMSKKPSVGFAATTTIKRSDFGMTYIVPLVSDEVKLTINAAFEQG